MRVTASKAALLMQCGYFAREGVEWAESSASDDASFGKQVHSMCEALITGQHFMAPTEDRMILVWSGAARWIEANRKAFWLAEVAFAWDPDKDTARQLPKGEHRDYSDVKPHELAGTADVAWYDLEADAAVIWDFKTGHDVSYAWPQLKTLGLMAARAFGAATAVVHCVKLTEAGAEEESLALDAFQLAVVAGQLSGLLAEVATAEPSPGEHCTSMYCPARAACPATTKAMEQVLPADPLTRFRFDANIESAQKAEWLLPRMRLVADAAEVAKDALKAWARTHGGIACGNGGVWREVSSVRRYADPKKLVRLARMSGASEAAIAACYRESPVESFLETKGSR